MNILITGIHGFVGSNLVQKLKAQHTIYGLDIINVDNQDIAKTYNWNELDILPQIDTIIHLAGKAHDTKNKAQANEYFEINTGLTKKIYDWFQASNTSKFIFFSSVKAAAEKVNGILTEEVIPTPAGPYGESKIEAEKYILSHQTTDSGQQTYILRPCMIHGPGNKGNLNLLYKVVKMGIPYPLGAFKNERSFCSIDNISFVVSELISKNIESGIYNICDDETVSTTELIELIANSLKRKPKVLHSNKTLINFLAKTGSTLHLPFNSERLQKLTENYVVSNAKIKQTLGYKSMPVSAKNGLIKTLNSFYK